MTARTTYEASCVTANSTVVANHISTTNTAQESINAAGVNAGKPLARGVAAADDVTIRNANKTYLYSRMLNEMAKQVSIQSAKDTLRATGDSAPA